MRRLPPVALLAVMDAHPVVLYALASDGNLDVRADGTLAPAGWLDVTSLGTLVGPLGAAVRRGDDVAIDLGDVDFVDVTGLRLLADAARELHARGRRLVVSHVPPPVPAMLSLLGLEKSEGLVVA
jgi:anti-anti-sigma factor